jgi:signal transduction histidine kinase
MKIKTTNPVRQAVSSVLAFFGHSMNGLHHLITHQNMKTQSETPEVHAGNQLCIKTTSIHRLISKLQKGLLPQTTCKKNVIVNDVDKTLAVFADENILAFIMGSLLSSAVDTSPNCCIRVEAFLKENLICIRIRNNGAFIYNSQMNNLREIGQAASKLYGNICIQTGENRPVTVTLSIPFIHVK